VQILSIYSFNTKKINIHKNRCGICQLDEVNRVIIDRMILFESSFEDIEEECNNLDVLITKAMFITHKKLLPILASPEIYIEWVKIIQDKLKQLENIQDRKNEFEDLKVYFEKVESIINKKFDIIEAKQETLLYMSNILIPQLLKTTNDILCTENENMKYLTGLGRVIDVIFNKSILLEASVGNLLTTPGNIKEEKEDSEKYDPKKLLEFIRDTNGKI
jgi:hypothetical protein